jgi:hypothetical protein
MGIRAFSDLASPEPASAGVGALGLRAGRRGDARGEAAPAETMTNGER